MKKTYRKLSELYLNFGVKVHIMKMWTSEWAGILRKRILYKNTHLTKQQVSLVNSIWNNYYGRKISLRWHRLYQSINGEFNEYYFPDVLFSTKLEPKLNPIHIAKLYSDKSLSELIYQGIDGIKFPKSIIINSNGIYYDQNRDIISKEQAINNIIEIGEFVIKPTIGGSSGNSVQVHNIDNHPYEDRKKKVIKLINEYENNYMIQLKLKSNVSYANLYNKSVNTIRLITYVLNDKVYHASLTLRMGTGDNMVDNIHAGGIVVGVSDDGILRKHAYQLGYSDSKTKYAAHPDTGVIFENYKIPKTKEMIRLAKKLHTHTPHMGVISWDMMVDDSGSVVLVEGNYYGQSIWFPQIVNQSAIFGKNTDEMISLIS